MGRRRKHNKKNEGGSTTTPPPEENDTEVDNANVPSSDNVLPSTTDEAEANLTEPAEAAGEPAPTTEAAPTQQQQQSATEVSTAFEATPAPPMPTPSTEVAAGDAEVDKAPQPPTTTTTTTAAAAAMPATAPLEGVAALNAYALENASTVSPTMTADLHSKPAAKSEVENRKLAEGHPVTEETSGAPTSPPRTSTKKVAFVTPVVSSVTSVGETDASRESNCIEARCGSCSVM